MNIGELKKAINGMDDELEIKVDVFELPESGTLELTYQIEDVYAWWSEDETEASYAIIELKADKKN
jgi:hypothetical protein